MIAFTCVFGQVGNVSAPVPQPPLFVPTPDGGLQTLEEVYADASDRDIELRSDGRALDSPENPDLEMVDQFVLQDALDKLTQNSGNRRVERLGILYANKFRQRPAIFGMMFDTAFRGDPGPNIGVLPREGCAVFLDAIAAHHQDDSYARQVAFTTVHELGHVFNLQHRGEANFLRTSSFQQSPELGAFQFADEHREDLQRCSSDAAVCPGGSEFSDITANGNEDAPKPEPSLRKQAKALELVLDIEHLDFTPFSPVELDITIRLKPGVESPIDIPNEIDPGYRRFAIWIEMPNGELRRYRSTAHYCAFPDVTPVTVDQPFRRDISIFGQAGGYTFRRVGNYQLWATFQLAKGVSLVSNKLSLRVRPLRARTKAARSEVGEIQELLQRAARTLFYRSGKLRPLDLHCLERLTQRHASAHESKIAHLAIAQSLTTYAEMKPGKKAGSLSSRILMHLERAERYLGKDDYRRKKVERCCSRLELLS
jgi:hypothetical protein